MTKKCPCKSDKNFDDCCGPYILGNKNTPTAEATMRARYSSFATNNIDFIQNTINPDEADEFNRDEVNEWSKNSKWLGLEVINTENGKEKDSEGIVEFKAHYEAGGIKNTHHEVAQFNKLDGKWYFMDGQIIRSQIIRSEPKVGRNDPCPCGSGKKFKKCCVNK